MVYMGRIYFFCDSQMNILTAYFMMKIYYDFTKYEKILLVSNNSDKSVACARRAIELGCWSKVDIIEEAFQGQDKLLQLCNAIKIEKDDVVYLFALQNRFARALYKKARAEQAKVLIVDEGIILFKNFLEWQKINSNEMFADIDVLSDKVEGWCYEPAIFDLPSNVKLSKIELQKYLKNELNCKRLQEDVKMIFDVKEEKDIQIIYFDQYYSLNGRTIGELEKYWIEKIAWICGDLNLYIKPHPMERGFINKYKDIDVKIISSKDSPWEAIYFVNFYGKRDKNVICLSGESTAMANPLLMYGDTNYHIILLRKIFNRYMRSHKWMLGGYFEGLKNVSFSNGEHLHFPNDFKEFNDLIGRLTESEHNKLISDIDDKLIEKLSKEVMDSRPPYFLCVLQIYSSGSLMNSIVAEQVICDENFELKYHLPDSPSERGNLFKWIPCGRCFIGLKEVIVEVHTLKGSYFYNMECLMAEQPTRILTDGFIENISINPSYLLKIPEIGVKRIVIKGKWKLDFDKNRLVNAIEKDFEIRHNELNVKLIELERNWRIRYQEIEKKLNKKEQDHEIHYQELKAKLTEREEFIKAEKEQYDNGIRKLRNENTELNNKILEINKSISWRLTNPLRKIAKVFKR